MRTARIKIDHADTWYHCYNRTAGTARDRPFGDAEKEQFLRILRRVSLLYGVQVVAYQVMSNHYHLLVHAPAGHFSSEEVCRRYRAFHRGRQELDAGSPRCRLWQQRTRDISWFMRHLQQLFTAWFNRSRSVRRRGGLWADRFKHTILEAGAVMACWRYIENNPVRAGLVSRAGTYRFGSFGAWKQTGRHPYANHVRQRILPILGADSVDAVQQMLDAALDGPPPSLPPSITKRVIHRIRYWTEGLVIGSELFIRTVMARHHPGADTRRIQSDAITDPPLACWQRLRAVS
jgi:putative transposase